jgi:hypothetical protein
MAIMKRRWREAELPVKDLDKDIIRVFVTVKKNFDAKTKNRMSEETKAVFVAKLRATTVNLAPTDYTARISREQTSREDHEQKIRLLEDYVGKTATRLGFLLLIHK